MLCRIGSTAPVFLALLAACASTDAGSARRSQVAWGELWPELVDPARAADASGEGLFPVRRADAQGVSRLREAEQLWRGKDDEGFARARAEIDRDPVLAFWLTRMLVRDGLFHRERARADESAMVATPAWRRPFDAIVQSGAAAAPCVVLDLLRDRAADRRDFGAELLQAMGPEVLPAWERVFDVDDTAVRRYAVRAIAGWEPGPSTNTLLDRATRDEDFGVRAEAWRGLGRGGPQAAVRLRAALATERDPFVQRAIVEGLGEQSDLASATAVVEYLEAAAPDDVEGMDAAKRSLMKMSGLREPGSPVSWRRWLATRAGG